MPTPFLTLLWTHQPALLVDREITYLHAVAPASRFVVCYGGDKQEFGFIRHPDKLFIDDDTLRTKVAWNQSPVEMLARAYRECVVGSDVEIVFLVEWDHVILRGDFEFAIQQLMEVSGADFVGKCCFAKDTSNWIHSTRARRTREFMAFLRSISVREPPLRIYGTLGTGFAIRRAALEALVAVEAPKLQYHEMYLPTVLHHLGFRTADVDSISDLYDWVFHLPVKTLAQVVEAKRQGHFFVHPFKELASLDTILSAPGAEVLEPRSAHGSIADARRF